VRIHFSYFVRNKIIYHHLTERMPNARGGRVYRVALSKIHAHGKREFYIPRDVIVRSYPSICHCEEPLGDEANLSLKRLLRPFRARNDMAEERLLRLRLTMIGRDATGATLPCYGSAYNTAPTQNPLLTPQGCFIIAPVTLHALNPRLSPMALRSDPSNRPQWSRNVIVPPDLGKNRTKFIHSMSDILHWSVYRRGPIIKQIISSA
jgi:hypothetical protein